MKQGKRSVTEYWKKFRLVASEAELDDLIGGELLLGGMNTKLQNAWGTSSDEYENTEVVAQWVIQKKIKLATFRNIQGTTPRKNTHWQRETITQRNPQHINPRIIAIRTSATPWNWMLPENDQDSTSQEKSSKGE